MYEKYVFNENNQNPVAVLLQEAADFLMRIGQELDYTGRVLTSIGDGLFAVGQILLFF
jgi:hypothetical protein